MKHSDKMVNFLQNKKPVELVDLPFGCPECGAKFVEREGNIAICPNNHRVVI